MKSSTFRRLAGWSLLALSALAALCIAVLLSFDWNRARPGSTSA